MNQFKKIIIIFLGCVLALASICDYVKAADFSDQFTQDMSTLQDTFSDSATRKDSIRRKQKKEKEKEKETKKSSDFVDIDIKSDVIDYYPDRQEIEAVGNAAIIIPSDGSTLRADKLVLNQETGVLTGIGNVRLIKSSNVMEGDFVKINLREKNAFMDNVISENMFISIKSENATVRGKEIILENGEAISKEDKKIQIGNYSFGRYGTSELNEAQKTFYLKENHNEEYTIKAKEIIVDAQKEHDTVTLKNADLYLKDIKITTVGTLKFITNKEQQFVETNIPEIGFIRQLGLYAGPGFAFGAPFDGSLKIIPFFNTFKNEVGFGGIARYRNEYNVTEFAIASTDESKTILRGEQQLAPDLKLQYGINGYMDEWWLGDRVAGKTAELVYQKKYEVDDIGMTFSHRISGGIMEEFNRKWSTGRFRWMGEGNKTLWYYGDDVKNRYATLEFSTQGMGALYGTGDTMALLRFGPRLRMETDRWIQTLGYFYTAKHGDTPFMWDKYRYGTNNLYLSEGIKLNKYLSFMWSGSLAMNRDSWDDKLLKENRFYVMVGPEDIKFTLGYDTVRDRTLFNCFVLLGTKNTKIEYKKLYIKNVDSLGKSDSEERKKEKAAARLEAKAEIKPTLKQRLFKQYKTPQVEPEVEETIVDSEKTVENPHEYNIKYEPEPEVIIPKAITRKKQINAVESIKPEGKKDGFVKLKDRMEQSSGIQQDMPLIEQSPLVPMQMMVNPITGR